MFGYKSQMIFLPDHGVGAVILTNADSGGYLSGLFGAACSRCCSTASSAHHPPPPPSPPPRHSAVASRKNDDGTISFVTIDPTVDGFTFVVGERDGKQALVIRDNQHEYPLIEQP